MRIVKNKPVAVGWIAILTVACVVSFGSVSAFADGPRWVLTTTSAPRNLPPGGTGQIVVMATNSGGAPVNAPGDPVVVTVQLPAGVTAAGVSREPNAGYLNRESVNHVECPISSGSMVTCVYPGGETLPPYETLEIRIAVTVETSAKTGEEVEVNITGGETPPVTVKGSLTVSSAPTPFGVEDYELIPENEDGSLDTHAGSHPFQLTTPLSFNETLEQNPKFGPLASVPTLTKDLRFKLPPGLIANPTVIPQCSNQNFETLRLANINLCPPDTAVGVAIVTANEPVLKAEFTIPVPVFNLKPEVGEPLRMGWDILGVPTILDTSIPTGGEYGAVVTVSNIPQSVAYISNRVSLWGVPGDPRHDQSRGWQCIGHEFWRFSTNEACSPLAQSQPSPFLELPTSCTGPLQTSVEAKSWPSTADPSGIVLPAVKPPSMVSLDGCNRLSFSPEIKVASDTEAGSSPSGLTVDVHVPQDESLVSTGLSESTVKDTTVALPEGVALNPAAADGLLACSEAQVSLENGSTVSCHESSKIGTVEINSPLLPDPVVGVVYLAAQNANPFGSLVAMYIVAEDAKAGFLLKVAGEVKPDPVTGQLVSTFKDTPQLPFEDLKLHFFGGSRAPLSTPASCGSYRTTSSIAPWSGNTPVQPSSTFQITSGPNGSACANPLPFSPSLTAGSTNIQAGAFTPFTMTMSREDGQQNLKAVQLHMPQGLLGTLSSVKLCKEAQANAGTCGAESEIGETIVSVGLGGNPFSVTGGKVYITEGYAGAPYGLSIVNPAKAGPYDLGTVVVRAKIEVDPITAALTVTTDSSGPYAIPQILDGIPLQIKHVNVTINRPGFTFNPTNCSPMAITGSLTSSQGATGALSVPFQATNCATLAFKPQFKVSTAGKTSRANGASLDVKLAYPKAAWGSQANIKSVKVDLPKQLPSRLTTLQKACPDRVFEQNPASCPAASRIGMATASTPIIPVGLTGPAFFVSHGGAKFPELIVVLSGYGVSVQLHGETFISKAGITSSTFRTIPDVPIGSFELKLPQGNGSALAANGNLCAGALKMPTVFTAQNGLVIHQSTPVTATGCDKHKKTKKVKRGNTHGKKR